MSNDRMTSERVEEVIEEIATTLRQFAGDDRGLHTIALQLIRPDGMRTSYINYIPEEPNE